MRPPSALTSMEADEWQFADLTTQHYFHRRSMSANTTKSNPYGPMWSSWGPAWHFSLTQTLPSQAWTCQGSLLAFKPPTPIHQLSTGIRIWINWRRSHMETSLLNRGMRPRYKWSQSILLPRQPPASTFSNFFTCTTTSTQSGKSRNWTTVSSKQLVVTFTVKGQHITSLSIWLRDLKTAITGRQ